MLVSISGQILFFTLQRHGQLSSLTFTCLLLSQTPIYEEETDAKDNLSGALLFAGHHAVSEVGT